MVVVTKGLTHLITKKNLQKNFAEKFLHTISKAKLNHGEIDGKLKGFIVLIVF